MKTNTKYLVALVLLVAVSAAVYWYTKKQNHPKETDFAIAEVNEIGTIELSSKYGNKMMLSRSNNQWLLNNNYPADPVAIKSLLDVLHHLEVESNVPDDYRQKIILKLASDAIKIKVTDKSGDEIKTIYAGGDASSKGAFMILEKDGKIADNPYIVNVPGFRGQFMYKISLDTITWRSKRVFETESKDLSEISVQYTDHPRESFKMVIDEDEILVKPAHDSLQFNRPVDRDAVVRFLMEMSLKSFEYYADQDSAKVSILAGKPFCTISTVSLEGEKKSLQMYYMPVNERSFKQKEDLKNPNAYDRERFFGLVSGRNNFVVGQYLVFSPVLKRYSDFFKSEQSVKTSTEKP